MMTATQGQQATKSNDAEAMPMMAGGGKLNMVKNKAGEMVPDFAADGKGKMMYGGMAKKRRQVRCIAA